MPNTRPTNRRLHRVGFTLTEIMIALGVMGVALGMAAAAFQAGIQSNNSTMADVMRSIIAENAVAIAKARLIYYTADANTTYQLAPIGLRDLNFPTRTASDETAKYTSGRGYLMATKRNAAGKDDYTFRIRPYVLAKTTYKLEATAVVNCTIANTGSNSTVTPSSGSLGSLGSYIMAIYPDANTQTARISTWTSTAVTVPTVMTTGSSVPVTVLVVKDANGTTLANPNTSDGRVDVLPEYLITTSLRQAP